MLPILVLMACNASTEKKTDTQTSRVEMEQSTSASTSTADRAPHTSADYSALFLRDQSECDVLSVAEMASVLNLDASDINLNREVEGYCRYKMQLEDGTKTTLTISLLAYDRKTIKAEIASFQEIEADFGKDNGGDFIILSDTNDTYFCIRRPRGELFMFNPNYDGAMLLRFGSAIEAVNNKLTYTDIQKEQRLDNALAVANVLLKKYAK